jgi:polar amino acid transport system substrate-binding protein
MKNLAVLSRLVLVIAVMAMPVGLAKAGNASPAGPTPADAQLSASHAVGQPPAGAPRTVLRFLTDTDFPPFNFIDEEGQITGFNVDLARAICVEMEVTCDIKATRWVDLLPPLDRGEADAVIASIAVTPGTLAEVDFTVPYAFLPARFAVRKNAGFGITASGLESRRIGVLKYSAHEAYIKKVYPDSQSIAFDSPDAAREALAKGDIDALFGDGLSLAFWANGTSSKSCCELKGGPFFDSRYFGEGLSIAVRKGDIDLKRELDRVLARIIQSSRYEELLLRYFPLRPF